MMKKYALGIFVLCGLLMASSSYADGITVQMKDATVIEVAAKIASEGYVAIIIDKNVNGNLKIPLVDFRNEPTERALLKLTMIAGLAMTYAIAQNSNPKFGIPTYFLTNLSIASRQQLSLATAPPPVAEPREMSFFIEPCLAKKVKESKQHHTTSKFLHYSSAWN